VEEEILIRPRNDGTIMGRKLDGPSPRTVDDYLASLPEDKRAVLEELRATVRALVPDAEERISYGIPIFYHHGGLVGFHAAKDHCSLHLMSRALANERRDELEAYEMTVATVHFPYDKPLPLPLIRRLVRARVKENEAREKDRKARKKG
jgi:uncharacterized protein YdhG (YjbR/CyaY superfamily)